MAGYNHSGVLVEEPAASEALNDPEANPPDFTAVDNCAGEVLTEDEAGTEELIANDDDETASDEGVDEVKANDVDEAASAETNVATPDEAIAEEVATAEVTFKREVESPWLGVCVLTDELYAIVEELYDWAEDTVVETVSDAVTVI